MVTAEIATALPVLVALVVAAVWTVTAASIQTRCADAAREGARAAARGEDDAVVVSVAKATAPDGAKVRIDRNDGVVTVEVVAHLRLPPPFSERGPTIEGKAIALTEP
jgi:hypothetical protein